MQPFVLIAFLILAAAQVFIVFRFIADRKADLAKAVLASFLPFVLFFFFYWVYSLSIPGYIIVLAAAAQLTHSLAGYYFRLYERSKTFDRYQHAFATFAYALLAYNTLSAVFGIAAPKIMAAIFVLSLGITLGVIVEIFEFVSDTRGKTGILMQKGLTDTNFDLIFDSAGAAAAAVFSYFFIL